MVPSSVEEICNSPQKQSGKQVASNLRSSSIDLTDVIDGHEVTLSPRKYIGSMMNPVSCKELAASMNVAIPEEFICPISGDVMVHPLMTRTGLNFERTAIIDWFQTSEYCPVQGTPLGPSDLIANRTLEEKIAYWRWDNMLPEPRELSFSSSSSSSSNLGFDGSSSGSVIGIISPKKKNVEMKIMKHITKTKAMAPSSPLKK